MEIDSWKSQLRKGMAELAVLSILDPKERYGLEIIEQLSADANLGISAGTVYPLLNRLRREGKVESAWRETANSSHPRKYYVLTKEGRRFLQTLKVEWERLSIAMDKLCSGKLK